MEKYRGYILNKFIQTLSNCIPQGSVYDEDILPGAGFL